ncbi:MAG: hypothetical protein AAF721_31190 [Myxococcota bacterium]
MRCRDAGVRSLTLGIAVLLGTSCDRKPAPAEPADPPVARKPSEELGKDVSTAASGSGPSRADAVAPADAATRKGGLAGAVAGHVAAARRDDPSVASSSSGREPEPEPPAAADPPPTGLAPPSEAELRAWDRKDPAGEAHLYAWDRTNLDTMLGYFRDLECFYRATESAGDAFLHGTSDESTWRSYKRDTVIAMNEWQQKVFADHPRMLEKSKLVGNLLEVHEIAMHSLIKAYNSRDDAELEKVAVQFTRVRGKVDKYVTKLGGTLPATDDTDCEDDDTGTD